MRVRPVGSAVAVAVGLDLAAVAVAVAVTVVAAVSVPAARAQQAPPPDGLYEGWSSLRMRPYGPLAAPPPDLPEWLEVTTAGDVTTVTFVPARRVVWRIAWGPHGPAEKRVEVDGELFATAIYERDAAGRIVRKVVDGPGVQNGAWVYDYTTDAQSRPLSRRTAHAPRMPWGSRRLVYPAVTEELRVTWGRSRIVVRTRVAGAEVRRDELDAQGRPLRTVLGRAGTHARSLELVYVRDAGGRLRRVTRRLGRGAPARVRTAAPDPAIDRDVMASLGDAPLERREALLLLGAPRRSTDEGTGAARRITDDWAGSCWLNQVSAIEWDAAGLAIAATSPCICGHCVDASLPVAAAEVLGTDLHWTGGPWVRLDGALDVTADHRVMTPRGPIAAGSLRAGDVVTAADGSTRTLRSVEPLARGAERLGRNVRTRSGTFAAGGLLFESEPPRRCPPP